MEMDSGEKTKMAVAVFDKFANEYQEKFMNVDLYKDSFNLFCEHITKDNPRVLELACGPGNITRYLLNKRPDLQIRGTDLSENMIRLAKINNPEAEFFLMDSRNILQLNEKFDALMIGFCLPYLSREESIQLIADAAKVLNDHGVIYLSTMEDDYSRSGLEVSPAGNRMYMHYHEAGYLSDALQGNGFKVLDLQRISYPGADNKTVTDLILVAVKN